MPPGFVHYRFYKAGFLISFPTFLYLGFSYGFWFGFGYITGYFFGRWIDPDWDIASINEAEGRAINELWIFGYILYGISSFYGAIFRRLHRNLLTHLPFLSTLIRILFVFFVPIFLLYSYEIILYSVTHFQFYFGFYLGLSTSDTFHFIADKIWSDDGKKFEKYRKKDIFDLKRFLIIKKIRKKVGIK